VLDHDATVLHNSHPLAVQASCDGIIPDSGLEPHGPRLLADDVRDVRRELFGSPEHDYHVDAARDGPNAAINRLTQYVRDVRVVNRYRDDLVTRRRQVRGYKMRRPVGASQA